MVAVPFSASPVQVVDPQPAPLERLPAYPLALAAVGAAAILAFVVEHLVAAPSLALVFVLPVLTVALVGGWSPSLLAAVASVLTYDFFFVTPRYSLRVEASSDLWALTLLLVIAAMASAVAGQSRRRARALELGVERAVAFRELARLAALRAPRERVLEAGAMALHKAFGVPAAVLEERRGAIRIGAQAGEAYLDEVDLEAAVWSIANATPSHGEHYPFDRSNFEIWPVPGGHLALAVDRRERRDWPSDPVLYFDLVGGLLGSDTPRMA